MAVGYMTNAWGATSGTAKGITSIKDLYYTTVGLTNGAFEDIKRAGFDFIEIFEGNLADYAAADDFKGKLAGYGLGLLAVYTGANFIYPEILPEELHRIERVCELAAQAGARYLTVGGGAVRHDGIREDDYKALGKALNKVKDAAERHGLTACYHPHLGTIVEGPAEIRKILSHTAIDFCPDCGHIHAAGGDAAELVGEFIDRIPYLHLKDFKDGGFAPLGTGELNVKRVLELIASRGIDCTVEAERIADPAARAREARKLLEHYGM